MIFVPWGKRLAVPAACVCLAWACLAAGAAAQEGAAPLETPRQKYSYAMGLRFADMLLSQSHGLLDADAVTAALRDRFAGRPSRLGADELAAALAAYQEAVMKKQREEAARNAEEGAAFLARNRERAGVKTLESGLQYLVHAAGAGASPGPEDTVVVHYRGRLLDGREFDSSHARGAPAEFPVGAVITGWQEALTAMAVGAKWEVWIPDHLAYGESGAGAMIGPGQTLHFEIELLAIK